MSGAIFIQDTVKKRSNPLSLVLCALVGAAALVTGCSSPGREQQPENTSRPFKAEEVAKLSHEAYKVAWDARFWALRDLRFASFRPTALDVETLQYLSQIVHHAPWLARDIEKHPTSPRISSKRSKEFVLYDRMMLKQRYHPASFRKSTDAKIEKLLHILDEIAAHYDEGSGSR